jgi:hypothetical protein
VNGGQFWGVNSTGALVATATTPGQSETFQLVRRDSDKSRVRIRAPNGFFLQVLLTHTDFTHKLLKLKPIVFTLNKSEN